MRAKFIKHFLFEFERSSPEVKDVLHIGNLGARTRTLLQKFSEENGYGFRLNAKGSIRISVNSQLEYLVTFPPERKDTEGPISLRRSGGSLLARLGTGAEVIKRIQNNIKRELKASIRELKPEELFLEAIRIKDIERVKGLLKSGVSPDHSVNTKVAKNIPILVAMEHNFGEDQTQNLPIIKILVEAGADLSVEDKWGVNPLSKISNLSIFKYLVENGADIFKYHNFHTFLSHDTISAEALDYILKKFPQEFSETLSEQEMVDLLTSAIWIGNSKKVDLLLKFGIDPHKDSSYGQKNNSFEMFDATEGYLRSHDPWNGNYEYEKIGELLKQY